MQKVTVTTPCGVIIGRADNDVCRFLGINYATAERFRYPVQIERFDGDLDATHFGDACTQTRSLYDLSNIPSRAFYQKEFRQGQTFNYSEDCLNLNIYTPVEPKNCPVLFYVHGGGFNSGANSEKYIDGASYAKRGIILVAINYRVGIFGYITHEQLFKLDGHEGNYGLADQITALKWVKDNIASFGGNPDKITLIGQSAGAISIQLMCLSNQCKGLFHGAIMLSGGGIFPRSGRPRTAEHNRNYYEQVMSFTTAKNFDEFRNLSAEEIFDAVEKVKKTRKDNQTSMMPVIDGYYLLDDVAKLAEKGVQMNIPYLIGSTADDMLSLFLYKMSLNWAIKQSKEGKTDSYSYFFNRRLPGDTNGAFHSSELYYVFGTLERSWRPFTACDYALSELMIDYLADFIRNGNPNGGDRPTWLPNSIKQRKLMIFDHLSSKMGRPNQLKLLLTTIKNKDPK